MEQRNWTSIKWNNCNKQNKKWKLNFFAPSYKRPEKSITQITYPFVKLVVKESEAEEYIKKR